VLSWDGGAYVTTFRQYADAVVFEQSFPGVLTGTSLNASDPMAARDYVSTAFPSLVPATELGYLAFSGDMTGSNFRYGTVTPSNSSRRGSGAAAIALGVCRISPPGHLAQPDGGRCESSEWMYTSTSSTARECKAKHERLEGGCFDFATASATGGIPTGVTGFGPAAFFTKGTGEGAENGGAPTIGTIVVVSSYSQFMAASAGPASGGAVEYGLQASITEIPANYSLSYIISGASGAAGNTGSINSAFEAWGDKLLGTYGKSREMTYRDYSLNYLGYSTDNGAYVPCGRPPTHPYLATMHWQLMHLPL